MASAALQQLEGLLQAKKLAGTLAGHWDVRRETASTGMAELDARLGGGWPLGSVSELIGTRSSGRTAVLVSTLARATARGQVVALVDALDRFDARAAGEAGVALDCLLWVRGAALTAELARPAILEHAARQAIRAFDLVLRAGGFGVVALDLGDIPPRAVRALPATTWLRLAYANEGRPTAGVILADVSGGRSARGVTLHLESHPIWAGHSPQAKRFQGFALGLEPRASSPEPSL